VASSRSAAPRLVQIQVAVTQASVQFQVAAFIIELFLAFYCIYHSLLSDQPFIIVMASKGFIKAGKAPFDESQV
jgi:hypothetical protein